MSTLIDITFKGGCGQLEATLFRNGVEIDKATIAQTGTIVLKDAEAMDTISINGVSPANGTDININGTVEPEPEHIPEGIVMNNYVVK